MFVPLWILFLLSGTLLAVGALVWSVRNQQFQDQDRARFLPLVGLSARELAEAARPPGRGSLLGTALIVLCGLVMIASALGAVLRVQ